MPHLVYDGSAKDTHTNPGVLKVGDRDGNTVKRVYVKQPVVEYRDLDVKVLWGKEFPKGEPVEVRDPALVRKAMALGCFDFDGPADWLDEKPKLRGRDARLARAAAAKAAAVARTSPSVPVRIETEPEPAAEAAPAETEVSDKPKRGGWRRKKDAEE